MRKSFTLLAVAAMMSTSAYAVSVQEILTDFEARGWDVNGGEWGGGDWDETFAPNRFTFLTDDAVQLSTSSTAQISLYRGETLLASQGVNGSGIDLWLGEFGIDFYTEVQTKEPGLYRLVIDDDFLTFKGESVTGGEYVVQFGEVVGPGKPQLSELLTLADARGWDNTASDGFGDWSDKVAPNRFEFEAANGVALSDSETAKVSLYFGETLLASQGVTGSGIDLWLGVFSVDFYSEVQSTEAGEYRLVIDEGFLTFNGEAVSAGEYTFTYEGSGGGDDPIDPVEVDFSYTLDPEAGVTVEKLASVEVSFTAYLDTDKVTYRNADAEVPVATITNEAGDFILSVKYPTVNDGKVLFEFGNEDTVWPAGTYTFTVNAEMIAVDMENYDRSTAANFPGLTATYTVSGYSPAPAPELADYITLTYPALECDNLSTIESNEEGGMMMYKFTANANVKPASMESYPDFILLTYTDEETGDTEYLPALNPNLEEELAVVENDPTGDGEATSEWTLKFNTDEDWGYSASLYQRPGIYTLILPNKTFELNGEPMQGTEYIFHYTVKPTAVEAIAVADSYVVYTIDGRVAYVGADKEAISGLDAGLYIINGQKVMIVK